MFSTHRVLSSLRHTASRAYNTNVRPLQKLAENFPHVGMILLNNNTDNAFTHVGSGVYHDGIVISAAHCFSDKMQGSPYFLLGRDKYLHPIKIKRIVKHPEYSEKYSSFKLPISVDIAVALLEEKVPVTLPKLKLEYDPTDSELQDCVTVGYPSKYFPRQEDNTVIPLENYLPSSGKAHIPIGVLAFCYPSTYTTNCLEHRIGYKNGKPEPYNILDSGALPGMSGGGVFTQKDQKLIGIHCAQTITNDNSNVKENRNYFCALTGHKLFLTKQLNEFKTALALSENEFKLRC